MRMPTLPTTIAHLALSSIVSLMRPPARRPGRRRRRWSCLLPRSRLAADKEVTVSGTGMCAKCELKETKKCQNAIQVEKDGKKVTYYLEDNQVSKDFHKNVGTTTEKVKATGTVSEKDGKMQLAATKIEVVK